MWTAGGCHTLPCARLLLSILLVRSNLLFVLSGNALVQLVLFDGISGCDNWFLTAAEDVNLSDWHIQNLIKRRIQTEADILTGFQIHTAHINAMPALVLMGNCIEMPPFTRPRNLRHRHRRDRRWSQTMRCRYRPDRPAAPRPLPYAAGSGELRRCPLLRRHG